MIEPHDIFVSHSHKDTEAVKKLVKEWEAWKLKVYADFKDQKLLKASQTGVMDVALVNRLREMIRRCSIFVFIATVSSASSGWMPWELGLAHGAVGRVHLYLLNPEAKAGFAGREYLELYKDTTFNAQNAHDYLKRAVAEAHAQPANPSQIEAGLLMGERARKAMQEGRFPELVREIYRSPIDQAGATILGMSGVDMSGEPPDWGSPSLPDTSASDTVATSAALLGSRSKIPGGTSS